MTWSRWLDNDELINDEDIDTDKECAYDVDIDHDAGEEDLHDDIDHDEDISTADIDQKEDSYNFEDINHDAGEEDLYDDPPAGVHGERCGKVWPGAQV